MRQVGRLGVWYPVDRLDGAGIRRLLRTVEDLGYSTFWYPEALGYESLWLCHGNGSASRVGG